MKNMEFQINFKTKVALVRVEMDSDLSSKVSCSSLVDEKNVVGKGDTTKGGQLDTLTVGRD